LSSENAWSSFCSSDSVGDSGSAGLAMVALGGGGFGTAVGLCAEEAVLSFVGAGGSTAALVFALWVGGADLHPWTINAGNKRQPNKAKPQSVKRIGSNVL
jgi:hypothetical protein